MLGVAVWRESVATPVVGCAVGLGWAWLRVMREAGCEVCAVFGSADGRADGVGAVTLAAVRWI